MALRGRTARLVLLVLAALAVAGKPGAAEGPYPLCPGTKQPPVAPKVPHSRCLSANTLSCCSDCADLRSSLKGISSKTSAVLCQLMPDACSMITNTKSDVQLCSVFVGNEQCQNMMEDLVCATSCNPDSGNYVKVGKAGWDFLVCSPMAQKAYAACKDLQLPGFAGTVSSILPDAESFLSNVFSSLAQLQSLGGEGYITKVVKGTTGCYNGAPELPPVSLCCDPLVIPSACPAGVVNFTANPSWKPFSNRPVDQKTCPAAAAAKAASNITARTTNAAPPTKGAASSGLGGGSVFNLLALAAAVVAALVVRV